MSDQHDTGTPTGEPIGSGSLEAEDLLTALEVIEDQPLGERAPAYLALHDELARRLDSLS